MLQLTITIGKLPRLCRPEKAREEISNLSSICSGLFCDFLWLAAADWHGFEGKQNSEKKVERSTMWYQPSATDCYTTSLQTKGPSGKKQAHTKTSLACNVLIQVSCTSLFWMLMLTLWNCHIYIPSILKTVRGHISGRRAANVGIHSGIAKNPTELP